MSPAIDPTIRDLNDCACCGGTNASTPVKIDNRPGLSAIAYRIGTQTQFKQNMLAALSRAEHASLGAFNTRDDDDFSIALLDSWAMVADVLTFYQERIANESYLRTSTERRSVLELVRSIGYELAPGVAAGTFLAFTVEDPTGTSKGLKIPAGTRAQSIPGQDELPQTFESSEEIEARVEWNAMRPRLTETYKPEHVGAGGRSHVYIAGTSSKLQPGDALLFVGDERNNKSDSDQWDLCFVKAVSFVQVVGSAERNTDVVLDRVLAKKPYTNLKVYALRQRAALFGSNAPDWNALPNSLRNAYLTPPLSPRTKVKSYGSEWPHLTIAEISAVSSGQEKDMKVHGGQLTADELLLPQWTGKEIADESLETTVDSIVLDSLYTNIEIADWVVLKAEGAPALYRVEAVVDSSRTMFTLNAKTTKLTLSGKGLATFNRKVRETVVYTGGEELPLMEQPITTAVGDPVLMLEGEVLGLRKDQVLSITGTDAVTGKITTQIANIASVEIAAGITTVTLTEKLPVPLLRETVTINANVVPATHGETKSEILGSGDGAQAFQRFTLTQKPLTYVSADNTTGRASTLEVRVSGVLWQEVQTLYGRGPREHVYITRADDEGNVTVLFGDGRTGSRLPTGSENVTATYRKGIGTEADVNAGQISLLMTRPLGVNTVVNPTAATGAANPQATADSRDNAPRTVLTLGRVVSLQDYEDFARGFAGIDKALATWTWNDHSRGVLVTVAGTQGEEVPAGTRLHSNLLEALRTLGDPYVPVQVKSYRRMVFTITGTVAVDPLFLVDEAKGKIESALRLHFSFATRSFGQPVHLSDVLAVIQSVQGVVFVDIDVIRRMDGTDITTPLVADFPPEGALSSVAAAELLILSPDPLFELLKVITWASM